MADVTISEVDSQLPLANVGHETLYADRALKNEKLSVRPILQKSKNTNMAGG
jgi:hypothetical protein